MFKTKGESANLTEALEKEFKFPFLLFVDFSVVSSCLVQLRIWEQVNQGVSLLYLYCLHPVVFDTIVLKNVWKNEKKKSVNLMNEFFLLKSLLFNIPENGS